VMEYLQGESAATIARRARSRGIAIDPALSAYIVAQACAGLHAAHDLHDDAGTLLGLVHRDVSPHNIFVTYDGSVKVLDFGIAKAADRITQTEAGTLKGKYEYMSPEQALGRPLDRRSDVFSLGIVLYELATRHYLFRRATPLAALRAVTDDEIPAPTKIAQDCPPALEAICLRALARDPDERYASAAQMRRDLLAVLRTSGPDVPEEALAALMIELFGDRARAKRELVEKLAKGAPIDRVEAAQIEVDDLPSVADARTPRFETIASAARTRALKPRRRRWIPALFAVLAVAGLAGAVAIWMPGRDAVSPPPIAAPEAPLTLEIEERAPVSVLGPERAAPAFVTLRVESTPSGASIEVDGERRGTTPATLQLPHGADPVAITLRRAGYSRVQASVVPSEDRVVRRALTSLRRTKSAPVQEEFGRFQ
jgi:eukaryotic-like serine/threonine-protein kinase